MTPWLFQVELTKPRYTQNRCRQLNNESIILKDDRKPFVVISVCLMELTVPLRPLRNNTGAIVIPISSLPLSSVTSSHAVSSIATSPCITEMTTTSSTSSSAPLGGANSSSVPLGGAYTSSTASGGITSPKQPKHWISGSHVAPIL